MSAACLRVGGLMEKERINKGKHSLLRVERTKGKDIKLKNRIDTEKKSRENIRNKASHITPEILTVSYTHLTLPTIYSV